MRIERLVISGAFKGWCAMRTLQTGGHGISIVLGSLSRSLFGHLIYSFA